MGDLGIIASIKAAGTGGEAGRRGSCSWGSLKGTKGATEITSAYFFGGAIDGWVVGATAGDT